MAAQASEPRVRVAAAILDHGRIVLVEHDRGGVRYLLLPGGGVEAGESLTEALEREVLEETGLLIRVDRLLFVNDTIAPDGRRHVVNVTFAATAVGGQIAERPDDAGITSVRLISPAALSGLDLRPPIGAELARAADHGLDTPATYLGSLWTDGAAFE